jgi:iron complex outermembrane recepter protein
VNTKSSSLRLLLGTTALSVVLAGSVAFAQEAPAPAEEDADEAIVVTGIRGALQNAAEIKRNASTFVDSITASDVSALPDNSVAEALGRIPGVSVTRYTILPQFNEGGAGGASADFPSAEGSGNLIRGLSFVRSEFNGRDQFTANGGRALDWASIPPELVGGVDVYKNSSAELIEGGIGGTINLRTLEPFDREGSVLAITGDATYADLREEWSPAFSVLASNRWDTRIGEFGLMGSYSRSELSSLIHDWQQGSPVPRINLNTVDTAGPDKFIGVPTSQITGAQQVFQLRHNEQDRVRESYYLAGQWQNDTTRITAKYVNVENGVDTVEHTVEYLPDANTPTNTLISGAMPQLGGTPSTLSGLTDPTTSPYSGTVPLCNIGWGGPGGCSQGIGIGSVMTEGWLTSAGSDAGSAYGYGINTLGRGVVEQSTTEDISINIKHDFSDQLHLTVDAHRTTADASLIEQWSIGRTYFMVRERSGLENPEVEFVMDPRGNAITNILPGQTVQGNITSTSDPRGYLWLAGNDNSQRGTGELTAVRADIEYEFAGDSWFDALKFGARYSERSQVNESSNQNWSPVTPPWSGGALFSSFASTPGLIEVQDYGDFFRGGVVQGANTGFVYIGREYLLDIDKMSNLFQTNPLLAGSGWQPRGARYPEDRRSDITEETQSAYIQLDFGHELGGAMSLEGNIGVRYVTTDLSSAGNIVYNEFSAEAACTPGVGPGGVVTTAPTPAGPGGVPPGTLGACQQNSPQDFLPQTTAFLAQASAPFSQSQSDEHYLPSLNVKWNLNDEMLIRFGVSENLTRPNIQDLRAYSTRGASTITTNWPASRCADLGYPTPPGCNDGVQNIALVGITAGGGNPRLRPTTSTNYDLSFEWYFDGGYFSAAVFQKSITDLISGGSESLGTMTLDGVTVPVTYSGQVNSREVDISGFELGYQQFFDFLPGMLSNLGMQANYTFIDASSEADPACVNNNEPCRFGITNLFGVSENLANIVGIYQDDKFEARLAYSWRDEFLLVKGDYMTGNPTFNQPEGILDGSVRYNVNDRLQFRGSVSNILDTRTETNMQVDSQGSQLERFSILRDRRFVIGFRYQY